MITQLDAPVIMKEITPMGSVFNEVEPSQGIVIMENGKTKYGGMNLSRKSEGMMTLEEYRL